MSFDDHDIETEQNKCPFYYKIIYKNAMVYIKQGKLFLTCFMLQACEIDIYTFINFEK